MKDGQKLPKEGITIEFSNNKTTVTITKTDQEDPKTNKKLTAKKALINNVAVSGKFPKAGTYEVKMESKVEIKTSTQTFTLTGKKTAKVNVFGIFLRVDGDDDLDDMVGEGTGKVRDGVENYLPGQEGNIKKLIADEQKKKFNETRFTPQQMKLIAEFPAGEDIDKVIFSFRTSSYNGYCSNKTDDRIKEARFNNDFSFSADMNQRGFVEGAIAGNRASIDFFCKDYGGLCAVTAVFKKGTKTIATCSLRIPVDKDKDGIADIYEKRQILAWNKQYGLTGDKKVKEDDLTFFNEDRLLLWEIALSALKTQQ